LLEKYKIRMLHLGMVVSSLFTQKHFVFFFFFASNLSSSWCSHAGFLFTNKEQKKVGS